MKQIRIWKPEKRKMRSWKEWKQLSRDGVKESAPMAIAKNLMEMLVPFVKESVGESKLSDRILTMEKKDGEITEDNLDWEKEADMDAALDFADSFLDGYEIAVTGKHTDSKE